MTDRKPQEIEREIEAERSALERSIEQLQAQFSADALVEQASSYIKTHGSDLASTIARTARDNPVAVAVTGVGLAMLLSGRGGRLALPAPRADDDLDAPAAAYDTRSRPVATGFATEEPPMAGFDTRLRQADRAMRTASADPDPAILPGREHHLRKGSTMTDQSFETHEYESPSSGASGVKGRATQMAADLRQRIDDGTAGMSDAARARVRQAREAAIAAQDALERQARDTARTVRRTSQDNPLLVGALVFAAGAVLAASLPRTATENRAIGAQRDRLFDEADRIFREEAEKLKAVAKAAVDEGKSAAKDALSSDTSTPDADSAVSRVSQAAKGEAERQGVGRFG